MVSFLQYSALTDAAGVAGTLLFLLPFPYILINYWVLILKFNFVISYCYHMFHVFVQYNHWC